MAGAAEGEAALVRGTDRRARFRETVFRGAAGFVDLPEFLPEDAFFFFFFAALAATASTASNCLRARFDSLAARLAALRASL